MLIQMVRLVAAVIVMLFASGCMLGSEDPGPSSTIFLDSSFSDAQQHEIREAAESWTVATQGVVVFSVRTISHDEALARKRCVGITIIASPLPEPELGNTGVLPTANRHEPVMANTKIQPYLEGTTLRTVAAHEIGHALMLGHTGPGEPSIMRPYVEDDATLPTAVDVAALIAEWIK